MKKFTLLFLFAICGILVNAQTQVFLETCGTSDVSAKPNVTNYTGWDNLPSVSYAFTTTSYPDVRSTSTLNNHVWFPANKETDLVISGINLTGYKDLTLTFDLATNAGATYLATANANKLTLYFNDVQVTVPSGNFTAGNSFINVSVSLPQASTGKLRFYYSIANNPTNYGYRLDNIKIMGDKESSSIKNTSSSTSKFFVADNVLTCDLADGTAATLYNAVGKKIKTVTIESGEASLVGLSKGLYIVKAGLATGKVLVK